MVPRPRCSRHVPAQPWNGVNLGGWLLLEPGPASPLFDGHPDALCEWDLLLSLRQSMGENGAREAIQRHRETHVTLSDFKRIRACGLNAVRVPLGHWVVKGPSRGEPYVGPALEFVDRAVDWAEQCGLQVVLDLHGCPGGESGDAPCGRRQRPVGTWHWRRWRLRPSIQVLKVLASRYRSRKSVTGIEVCNEPSNTVPLRTLFRYYGQAIHAIRSAGMRSRRVAVILPIFQRPEEEVALKWKSATRGRHRNVCFDVHCYHCFENHFNGMSLSQHMRAIETNAAMLKRHPMVVGEWSLALGVAAWTTCGHMSRDAVYRLFGGAQREALKHASHGHFFWNWSEKQDAEWNFQLAHKRGFLSRSPPALPWWDGAGEDPLEEMLHESPSEPRVFYGDWVFLRVFHGRYIDVDGTVVSARYAHKGEWQRISFVPIDKSERASRSLVQDCDIVRLRAHDGRWIAPDTLRGGGRVVASVRKPSGGSDHFLVSIKVGGAILRHRSTIFLTSTSTGAVLDADDRMYSVSARWPQRAEWQLLCVEKQLGRSRAKRRQCEVRLVSSAKRVRHGSPHN